MILGKCGIYKLAYFCEFSDLGENVYSDESTISKAAAK